MFVAIELSDAVKKSLVGLSGRLRPCGAKASWVREEHIHLTLRFLDEVGANEGERLAAILEERYAGTPPFALRASGVGVFPNRRRPSVVWVGVTGARDRRGGGSDGGVAPELLEAWRVAEESAQSIGAPPETKPFHPHLTLARIRDSRQSGDLAAYLEQEHGFDGGEFPVEHVALFESTLTPRGPNHRLLKEFRF